MTAKKKVSVQIEGRSYALITSDEEKYVQSVADEVSKHIRKTVSGCKQLDIRDCAILAALDFCDDRNKAMQKNKDYIAKADKIIRQTNDLNKLCTEYKEKLTESINENTSLVRKLKSLEKEVDRLTKENDKLKAACLNLSNEDDKSKPEKPVALQKVTKGYAPVRQYSLFDDEDAKKKKN